jgi:beta-xylosidase
LLAEACASSDQGSPGLVTAQSATTSGTGGAATAGSGVSSATGPGGNGGAGSAGATTTGVTGGAPGTGGASTTGAAGGGGTGAATGTGGGPGAGGAGGNPGTDAGFQQIVNDVTWKDTTGKEILSQGGGMMKMGSTYYWYGNSFNGGVSLYTSPDLAHWTFVKLVLKRSGWLGRPDVIYNATTKKYVLVVEVSGAANGRNQIGYATADAPDGDFVFLKADPKPTPCCTMGDHSVFQDTDGKAYLVYTYDANGVNTAEGISPLGDDYLSIGTQQASVPVEGGSCEADNLLHVGNTYYWITSNCAGWDSSATVYRTSTDLKNFGPVQTMTTTPNSDNSFDTQVDFVITVVGTKATSYIYAGDRYSQFTSTPDNMGKNAWYPLTFDANGKPTLHGDKTWSIDAYTGEWKTP